VHNHDCDRQQVRIDKCGVRGHLTAVGASVVERFECIVALENTSESKDISPTSYRWRHIERRIRCRFRWLSQWRRGKQETHRRLTRRGSSVVEHNMKAP
jgi:hypothetical protein